ncbi:MAG: hypothetical protein O2972_07920 [Cyanobacteria bacterium]|nr:hypothetical protein [Cyanobacteriota bacterium]
MGLMIFSAVVVCLEWSDSMALGLNNGLNQSDHNPAVHHSPDLSSSR